ncbi:uncharacterized protein LOC133178055 [Saccostrea echinata]|uniref:uncharacterized protein LOC133178055 n=1 Tax=Saccostrea echinata TaxID=191078 RepID=UPI002A82784C|nr:uncharacterized protein LOC133178055 [Saccostrea echinata]
MASKEEVSAAFEEIKENVGLDALKSEQLDILTSIIRNEDCVGVLPTGYGKSLPYQVAKGQKDYCAVEECDIIFSSPEHLVGNDDWRGSLSKLKVSLIVVDEFHTVSTW